MTAIPAAFRGQAKACAALGSPLMARLMAGLADQLAPGDPVADRVLGWQGDPSSKADSVPLRLAGGLHALVLTGADPDLAAAYASGGDPTEAALAAIRAHPDHLLHWLTSPPQTNEVRRSAVLIAAAHWLTARFGLPLILSELGASAGLNLLWDHYALTVQGQTFGPAKPALTLTPDWTGALPPQAPPTIVDRRGTDLNPLDPATDRLRLLAYLWADQPDRITRTRAALDLAARTRPQVDRADAADWLESRLATPTPAALHLVVHTVAWQYFPPATQARALAAMDAAGRDAPLARLSMEADSQIPGAAITLTLWPSGETLSLGRADFHGRWVDWHAPALQAFPSPNILGGGWGAKHPQDLSRCALFAHKARQKARASALDSLTAPTRAQPARSTHAIPATTPPGAPAPRTASAGTAPSPPRPPAPSARR
jgi:hypothetical protein